VPQYLVHSIDSRFLCIGFQQVNTVAICFIIINEAVIASGWCVTPLAYRILCVRFTCFVHAHSSVLTKASLSATGAILDTGGWLAPIPVNEFIKLPPGEGFATHPPGF
jgi:hypothetical protein